MSVLEHTGHGGLTVGPGELVSVLGAPGSGKSRLALELAIILRPTEGTVLFRGKDYMAGSTRLHRSSRPKEVTLLVQDAEAQLFARTVFDDIAFGPRHLDITEVEIARRVTGALEAVQLDVQEVQYRSPFALSGGERRRVALAGLLAMEPDVLILDEPTASLDPRTRNEFLGLLRPLRGKSSIVWMTASAREASLASRAYLLRDGQTTEVSGGSALFHNWRSLLEAGVELPAEYELAGALEKRGFGLMNSETTGGIETSIEESWKAKSLDR